MRFNCTLFAFLIIAIELLGACRNHSKKELLINSYQPFDRIDTGSQNTHTPILKNKLQIISTVTLSSEYSFEVQNEEHVNASDIALTLLYTADFLPDYNKQISIAYKQVSLTLEKDKEKETFNSNDPDAEYDPVSRFLHKIVSTPLTLSVSKNGEILNREACVSYSNEILHSLDGLNRQELEKIKSFLNIFSSPAFLEQSLKDQFSFIPLKKVKPGSRWEDSPNFNADLKLQGKTEYEVTGLEDSMVSVVSNTKITDIDSVAFIKGQAVSTSFSGNVKGKYKVDATRNLLQAMDITIKVEGEIYAGGQNIPVTIVSGRKIRNKYFASL